MVAQSPKKPTQCVYSQLQLQESDGSLCQKYTPECERIWRQRQSRQRIGESPDYTENECYLCEWETERDIGCALIIKISALFMATSRQISLNVIVWREDCHFYICWGMKRADWWTVTHRINFSNWEFARNVSNNGKSDIVASACSFFFSIIKISK